MDFTFPSKYSFTFSMSCLPGSFCMILWVEEGPVNKNDDPQTIYRPNVQPLSPVFRSICDPAFLLPALLPHVLVVVDLLVGGVSLGRVGLVVAGEFPLALEVFPVPLMRRDQ